MKTKAYLLALLALSIIASSMMGSAQVDLKQALFSPESVSAQIFWNIRLPRILLAALTGAALGVSGCAFQALFRNNLASPYTLGVASSASFGAVLSIKTSALSSILGFFHVGAGAFIGALLSIIPLSLIRRMGPELMLVCGVVLAFFFSSLTLLVQSLGSLNESYSMIRWMMGGIGTISWAGVLLVAVVSLCLILMIWRGARSLDLIFMGDEISKSKGLDVVRERRKFFFLTSGLVALVVTNCGPIGFVGIVAPNLCRTLIGARMSELIPTTALASAIFLTVSDTIARAAFGPSQLPVGIVTALLGSPVFALLLIKHHRN